MRIAASDLAVGAMMVIFGLLGLYLGARAEDDAMYVFGLCLFGFAYVFIFGQIRRHFAQAETLAREVRRG